MPEPYHYPTPIEKKLDNLISPFETFIDTQIISGLVLICCVFLSLMFVNLPAFSQYYKAFIHTEFSLGINNHMLRFGVEAFVDEFLLLFFFLILGLEIKREIIAGELSDFKRTAVVLFASTGGIVAPIVFYLLINSSSFLYLNGWAIPTATDTAIAIGLLSLFKNKLPKGTFTLIAAIAIIDDIAAITIIALFYSEGVNQLAFLYASAIFVLLLLANLLGIRNFLVYLLLGLILWLKFEDAGIHGSIAGALIALTIPARPKAHPSIFIRKIKQLIKRFEKEHDHSQHILEQEADHALLEQVSIAAEKASVPLKRWEFMLEKPVLLIILPLFALTNGGITLNFDVVSHVLNSSLFWGIMIGLVIGKPLGITVFTYACLKTGIGKLPSDMSFRDVLPMAMVAGIGYTMSIFVANLAFDEESAVNGAKLSIICTSIIAGIITSVLIEYNYRKRSKL